MMTRRDLLKYTALGLLSGGAIGCERSSSDKARGPLDRSSPGDSSRPNVIWVVNDSSRAANYSCYGHRRPTSPAIDNWAKGGVLFENTYSQAFSTAPSVSCYMTSRLFPAPVVDWMYRGQVAVLPRPQDESLVPSVFSAAGYRTYMASCNRAYVRKDSFLGQSFDFAADVPNDKRLGRTNASGEVESKPSFRLLNMQAFSWLDDFDGTPFFMYLHALETHVPFFIPAEKPFNSWIDESYDGPLKYFRYPKMSRPLPEADRKQLLGMYDGCVRLTDHYFEQLIEKLNSLNLLDSTIIIYTSDHGEALYENGWTHGHDNANGGADETRKIPLIIAGPGVPANLRVPDIARSIDIAPTLYDLCDLPTRAVMDGESLVPLWRKVAEDQPRQERYAISLEGTLVDSPVRVIVSDPESLYELIVPTGVRLLRPMPARLANWQNSIPDSGQQWASEKRSFIDNVLMPRLIKDYSTAYAFKAGFHSSSGYREYVSKSFAVWTTNEHANSIKTQWVADRRDRQDPVLLHFPPKGEEQLYDMLMGFARLHLKGPYRIHLELWAGSIPGASASGSQLDFSPLGASRVARIKARYGPSPDSDQWVFVDTGTWDFEGRYLLQLRLTPVKGAAALIRRIVFHTDKPGVWQMAQAELLPKSETGELEDREEALNALGYL